MKEGEEGREVMQVNEGRSYHMLQQQTLPGPFPPAPDHFIYLLYIWSGEPNSPTGQIPCDRAYRRDRTNQHGPVINKRHVTVSRLAPIKTNTHFYLARE